MWVCHLQREKKEGWEELVTDTVLKEIWPDQWTILKAELSISYVPTAVDWRRKVSWLLQRGFPGSKLGKEIHLGVKKSEPHVRSFIEWRVRIGWQGRRIIKNNDIYVEPKIWHKWTYLWNRLTDTENRLLVAMVVGGVGRVGWEFGTSRSELLYREWINSKTLLYNTGDFIQCPMINCTRKEHVKECVCVYNWITVLNRRN